MSEKLPNEILLDIMSLLGEESTLYLVPFTLLNRYWHSLAAPVLLSTISVSSLGSLLGLCEQMVSPNNTFRSIETFTRTIIINGESWDNYTTDCHAGLEDVSNLPLRNEADGDPAEPDIDMPPEQVLSSLRGALTRCMALDGLEWYGRFAGDYYLTRFLQGTRAIRRVTYKIEECSSKSVAYRRHAFLFRGLKSLKIISECETTLAMSARIVTMMRRNPGLEKIVFDCKFDDYPGNIKFLMALISNTPQPETPILVWPNLRCLILRTFTGPFWIYTSVVNKISLFLAAHPHLETLGLSIAAGLAYDGPVDYVFSLSSYPESLPRLKVLLGSAYFIAGVLESRSACASVVSVIDDCMILCKLEQGKSPHLDRIAAAPEAVPRHQIRRLRLFEFSRTVYAKVARVAPRVQFLELVRPATGAEDGFDPLIDIPAELNKFTQLDIIGIDMVREYADKATSSGMQAALELAKQVPRIKAVHTANGVLINLLRDSDGSPGVLGFGYLDNSEYDWTTGGTSWIPRPVSQRAYRELILAGMGL